MSRRDRGYAMARDGVAHTSGRSSVAIEGGYGALGRAPPITAARMRIARGQPVAWAATSGRIANALALAALRGERTAIPFATDPLASAGPLACTEAGRLLRALTRCRATRAGSVLQRGACTPLGRGL